MNGLLVYCFVWLSVVQISVYGLLYLSIAVLLLLLGVMCVWVFALKKKQLSISDDTQLEDSKAADYANYFPGVFNNLPVATVVLDKHLTITDTNDAFNEIVGIDPQEYKDRKVSLLDNPLYTDEEKEQIRQGTYQPREKLYDLNKLTEHGYLHCNRKEKITLWTVLKAIKDAENKEIAYYLLMLIDHSKINTLLNNVLDHLPIPIMVKDAEHGFRYVYWNKESEIESHIRKESVIGKTDFDIYLPERAAAYRKIDEDLLVAKRFTKEETYQLPDGEERSSIVVKSLITNHESENWILVARWDITEQKKAEQQSKEAMDQTQKAMETNKLIFDNLNIGLVYVNLQYIVQWASVDKLEVLSLSEHYTPGKPCYETVYGRTKPCTVCPMSEMLTCGHSVSQVHCIDSRQVDITSNPVYDNDNVMIGAILRLEDITEKKRIEVELEAAKQSNKLKSAFLANMSHEIRTPLNAIVGFSNILINTEDAEEKKEYAKIIGNNNELLLQLVSDILDLSKIESDTLEFVYSDVDVNTLMNGIIQYARIRLGTAPIEICLEEQLPACVIHTEKNRLSQVLTNLVTNALKFTTKGSITMGYRFIENNTQIYFYVIDTGCGVEKNKINTIFDRFVKLNTFTQGTGLGLSICRTIVERLGGDLGVESEEGIGSKFWFTIPYQPATLKPMNIEPHTEELKKKAVQQERFEILIAEDDPSNYKLFESILGKEYTLIHAWNGKEAVELFKEHAPNLILMDIKMPEMDGYEATSIIRKYSRNIPIIATTAYAFSTDEDQIMSSGFNGYIAKPIHRSALKQRIQELLNNHFVMV